MLRFFLDDFLDLFAGLLFSHGFSRGNAASDVEEPGRTTPIG